MRTALHLFAGSGGCTLGFKLAGFDSLGSLDFDEKACRDLKRLTGGPAFCRDIAAMEPGELFDLTGGRCPDVVVMSPPCKSFSGCMPAAVVDERGWPVPTHHLVREGDDLVLYGPPIDLATKRPALLVIRAPDGTWHRPLTDRELATLQSFPTDCYLEGPSSSSKTQPGRREHIGNAIPVKAAQAIGEAAIAMLDAAEDGFQLVGGGAIWVERREEASAT